MGIRNKPVPMHCSPDLRWFTQHPDDSFLFIKTNIPVNIY